MDPDTLPAPAEPPKPERFWRKLARHVSRLPFARDMVAAYLCALDPETPTRVRAVLMGGIAYFILPLDSIPDAILGLGFTDDAAVIATMIRVLGHHIQKRHYREAEIRLRDL